MLCQRLQHDELQSLPHMPGAVVVIPAYRALTPAERLSLERCAETLGDAGWPLTIVCPRSLDTSDHERLVPSATVDRLADHWFESLASYSALLLSRHFYERFVEHEFILIHQLDCFVFQDQLAEWCARDWDYIAPPFFRNYTVESGQLEGVGCGGFSLRKTSSFLAVFDTQDGSPSDKGWFRSAGATLARTAHRKSAAQWRLHRAIKAGTAEDRFWASVPSWLRWFKIPGIDEAATFGFDMRGLKHMHPYYQDRVPFGSHAIRNLEAIHDLTVARRPPAIPHEYHLTDLLVRSQVL